MSELLLLFCDVIADAGSHANILQKLAAALFFCYFTARCIRLTMCYHMLNVYTVCYKQIHECKAHLKTITA